MQPFTTSNSRRAILESVAEACLCPHTQFGRSYAMREFEAACLVLHDLCAQLPDPLQRETVIALVKTNLPTIQTEVVQRTRRIIADAEAHEAAMRRQRLGQLVDHLRAVSRDDAIVVLDTTRAFDQECSRCRMPLPTLPPQPAP